MQFDDLRAQWNNIGDVILYYTQSDYSLNNFVYSSNRVNRAKNIEDDDIRWFVENHHKKIKNHTLKKLQKADNYASIKRKRMDFVTPDYVRRGQPVIQKKDLNGRMMIISGL